MEEGKARRCGEDLEAPKDENKKMKSIQNGLDMMIEHDVFGIKQIVLKTSRHNVAQGNLLYMIVLKLVYLIYMCQRLNLSMLVCMCYCSWKLFSKILGEQHEPYVGPDDESLTPLAAVHILRDARASLQVAKRVHLSAQPALRKLKAE